MEAIATKVQPTHILSEYPIIYAGYEEGIPAATGLARDALFMQIASSTKRCIIWFYTYPVPTVIFSYKDDPVILKKENLNGTQVVRRDSSGEVMFSDTEQLCYSIILPLKKPVHEGVPVPEIHAETGSYIAGAAIAATGVDPKRTLVDDDYSVRVDGEVLAGEAQVAGDKAYPASRAIVVEGALQVGDWDTAKIESRLNLIDEDYSLYKNFPTLKGLSRNGHGAEQSVKSYAKKFISSFLSLLPSVPEKLTEQERKEIEERSAEMSSHYADPGWINRTDIKLERSTRLCFRWSG